MSDGLLFTPQEVADLLRVSESDVHALYKDGTLDGMEVRGALRIFGRSVEKFLADGIHKNNERVMKKLWDDPDFWIKTLEPLPDLAKSLENETHPPGSMGEFLKNALLRNRALKDSDKKVVPFKPRRRRK